MQDSPLRSCSDPEYSGHRRIPPFGMAGGEPGVCGRNTVERADGTVEELQGRDRTEMNTDDVFVIETPGGGGYGKKNKT